MMADTPLHEAVRYSDLDGVLKALNEGYDPNELGSYQWTPLHEACNNGDTEIVKLLLQYNGNPNLKDSLQGCTAVHYAASQEHVDCLKLLISAGGRCDIANSEGQNAFDVAVGECQLLLQAQYDKNIYDCQETDAPKKSLDNLSISSSTHSCCKSDDGRYLSGSGYKDSADQDSFQDPDQISVDSGGSSFSRHTSSSWGSEGVVRLNSDQGLGKIELSFEYNSKKSTLKIRVWKVCDLLMPPCETSMIHSIYVKSNLLPDKKKETKRKTEECKIDQKSSKQFDKISGSGSEIFKPSSFLFSKSLVYENVTSSMISSREVLLSVCITQKFTHRSFTVATWSMPLKVAIKRVLKEKYSLKACISTAIPEHMKVYNATELDVIKSRSFGSNPSLICKSSAKWTETCQERSISDSDLNRGRAERRQAKPSSVEITFPETVDMELEDALQQIMIMEKRETLAEGKSSSTVIDLCLDKEDKRSTKFVSDSPAIEDDDLVTVEGITVEPNVHLAQVEIHIPEAEIKDGPKSSDVQSSDRGSSERGFAWGDCHKTDEEVSIHRPETPIWDYYTEDPEFASVLIHGDGDDDPSSVRLPMATTLELPKVHGSYMSKPYDEKSVTVNVTRMSSLSVGDKS